MNAQAALWIVFGAIVVVMLVLDLGVFHRRSHEVKFKEALGWCAVWVLLALVFLGLVYWGRGPQSALEFLTGYLIEESLSVDNLFVFLMIFAHFAVPAPLQHTVLFWGILGAMVLRAIFIVAGVVLIQKFQWMIYLFGLILIYSGIQLAWEKNRKIAPERNPLLKLFRRVFPVTPDYVGGKFFTRIGGRLHATPLALVLVVVETTDLLFAVDSIPAVLAITTDPFIVYTSNVLAILGLRAMYFALAGLMDLFHHLHYGLSAVLAFVGLKMVLAHWLRIPTGLALGVVGAILALAIAASLVWPKKKDQRTNMQSP